MALSLHEDFFFLEITCNLFGRKNRLNFGEDLFSFFEITCIWPETPFEFRRRPFFLVITCFWPEKPLQSNSRLIKIRVMFV